MRVVIIDDEQHCRNVLKNQIRKHCVNAELVGDADGVETGIRLIEEQNPDVIFLDIQMNDGTGFDLLNNFKEIKFKIIFTTAFDNYAIKAFQYAAVHYLLKPIDSDELVGAYNRISIEENDQKSTENLIDTYQSGSFDCISLKTENNYHKINLKEIESISADGSYCVFSLINKKSIIVSKPLKEYANLLPESKFKRIHKSTLINIDYAVKFLGFSSVVKMQSGESFVVSRRNKSAFLALFLTIDKVQVLKNK